VYQTRPTNLAQLKTQIEENIANIPENTLRAAALHCHTVNMKICNLKTFQVSVVNNINYSSLAFDLLYFIELFQHQLAHLKKFLDEFPFHWAVQTI
jgi:hypothetical protein